MTEQTTAAAQLGRVQKKLSSWRERHGGRGRPIPEELWRAVVDVAAIAGVSETARVLGVDRERLVRRVGARPSGASGSTVQTRTTTSSTAFVEVDAHRMFARGKTVVRLTSREGERLEIEVEGGAMDVVAVAHALWERAR
jgi:hypothetical protein